MDFVCPACKGSLTRGSTSFSCGTCRREYPVVAGIPDFRLMPDPYIDLAADREKGQHLHALSERLGFEELVRYYYSITPEDPPDHARVRIAHALAEVQIAEALLRDARLLPAERATGALLDLGCSTAALLIAAAGRVPRLVGIDVAFRWLVIGQVRLREAGVQATLVCANAEALPFPDRSFEVVTATDLVEHVNDPQAAVREAYRVLASGGSTLWTTNNRYATIPEPHVRLWGVGYLPRRWQRRYVAWRRADLHPYRVRLASAREIRRLFVAVPFATSRVDPAALCAPHRTGRVFSALLGLYNRLRRLPGFASAAKRLGPRLSVVARK